MTKRKRDKKDSQDTANTTQEESGVRDFDELVRIVESILLAADGPLSGQQIAKLLGVSSKQVEAVTTHLIDKYKDSGIVVSSVAGGFQWQTHPASAVWVQKLVAGKPVRLSRAQLETLAICAYRQPITRPEVDDIRGVDSSATLRLLAERGLVRVLGKKEEPGRPLLYGTTNEFLELFSLSDLSELPTLREFGELTEDSLRVVESLGIDEPEAAEGVGSELPEDAGRGDAKTEAKTDEDTNDESDTVDISGAESVSDEKGVADEVELGVDGHIAEEAAA